jgi:hypothetical protein
VAQTNRAVLAERRKNLGQDGKPGSHQAIAQRRGRLQGLVQMPSDIATYIVASREGIRLHKYLDAEVLEQVAVFDERVRRKEEGSPGATPARAGRSRTTPTASTVKELRVGEVKVPKRALSQKHMDDAKRMAEVYPILYAFENSMREFIDGHLTAEYGDSWWDDPKIVNSEMRKIVERNRTAEKQHRYHSKRTARFIYHTDIGHLPLIIQSEKGWKVFKKAKVFPSDKWVGARVEVIEASRNVVAHMNALQKRDIDRIKLNFEDWLDQIEGHEPPAIP